MKEIEVTNPLIDDEEEVAFTIVGTRNGEEARERFECLSHPPIAATKLLTQSRFGVDQYVRMCLKPDEEERFDKLMQDKSFNVRPQAVRDIYMQLLEHYSARPTSAPGASGTGRDEPETSSKDAGSSPELTSVG